MSPLALGLVELPSTKFIELSSLAAELLGTTREGGIGLDYLSIVEPREHVEQSLRLLSAGALDCMYARRRLRRADGSVIEALLCGRAIRSSTGADLSLWVVVDVLSDEERPAATAELLVTLADRLVALEPHIAHPVGGTIDLRWRVTQIDGDVEALLGHRPAELVGSSIIDLTHPRDAADLLLAFARATSERNAGVRVRMRHRYRAWQGVTAVVTALDGHADPPFAFVLAAEEEAEASADRKRVTELEHHMQRIAVEVQTAGVLRVLGPTADAIRVPVLRELSARQWEVLSRLARGERVSTIASEMYLSQSTVRNHLSAIFRKVGVHSQRDLLGLLRPD